MLALKPLQFNDSRVQRRTTLTLWLNVTMDISSVSRKKGQLQGMQQAAVSQGGQQQHVCGRVPAEHPILNSHLGAQFLLSAV